MTDPTRTAPDTRREVSLKRLERGRYAVTNVRGGTLVLGDGSDEAFTPVEALLAAIAGCSSVDVDHMTSRRAEPLRFDVDASGDKTTLDGGNALTNLTVTFRLEFPDGAAGDEARSRIGAAVTASHDRLCTVSRTIERGTPVAITVVDPTP